MIRKKYIRILLYLIIFQSFEFLSADINKINNSLNYVKSLDLPSQKDLPQYLKIITLAIAHYTYNQNYIDLNLSFGIFLSNVNLKRVINEKGNILPSILNKKLMHIIGQQKKLLNNSNIDANNDIKFADNIYKRISKLFSNYTTWVDGLEKLVNKNSKNYTFNGLEDTFSSWDYYLKDVDDVKKWTPSPKLSDFCLVSLSKSNIIKNDLQRCPVADSCYKMLYEGTNFGYALCHRALFLLMARYGRDCTIISPKKDKALMGKYCSMGYSEVEYIAMNNYGIVDLMMEIMCLCSLEGYAQFLRRSWLREISHFQNYHGCFGNEARRPSAFKLFIGTRLSVKRNDQKLSFEKCNSHTTAVALGTFSAAIRFIIETYF